MIRIFISRNPAVWCECSPERHCSDMAQNFRCSAPRAPCRAVLPAYRQRSTAEICPAHVDQPLAMRANWHVICITTIEQAGMWMIGNIRYRHCPYFGWRDLSMITAMNNSKLRTHSPDTYHHGDLRRALVQAALELAAENKDWNFSLREVARRAGVSHNAPYNHFPHKRDLLDAAAAAGHDLLRSELTAAVAKIADPRAALSKMSSAYVSFGIKNPALYRLMFSVAPSGPRLASRRSPAQRG